ncbi:MAG: bi-domain-containing oxidoreductase [Ignavibacteria bacterium]|nr:bi-domain-containing oxidoreductase [Ignavibacteria bacterium]
MYQIIQYQKTGELFIEELPEPILKDGGILVQNVYSLISAGTERASVETAQASMLGKAKKRPDLVKQVKESVKKEGLLATYKKVKNRLDNYKELGYSSSGIVIESSVKDFKQGDRVACAGGGYANHAEVIFVPKNLAINIPDSVSFQEGAFTTVGAIALQGVRQADVKIGENIVVIGLGLIGLITVQLLKASGVGIIGIDVSKDNFQLASKFGCDVCLLSENVSDDKINSYTNGIGADAVIITASTKSNEPVETAISIARRKAKVVIVGSVGMDIPRSPFYEKELDIKISCSYGPGRYDNDYEKKGLDYPYDYVRWTENRNMSAVVSLVSQKRLDVNSLITHKFPIQEGLKAYDIVTGKVKEKHLGILLHYSSKGIAVEQLDKKIEVEKPDTEQESKIGIGFIGAGNFAQSYLIPNLLTNEISLKAVATTNPVNAKATAKKFKFEYCTTDTSELLNDNNINTVFIATHHDSHAKYVVSALEKDKHVFVEKPLAITEKQLREIKKVIENTDTKTNLMVGFNRRFSKPFVDIKKFFQDRNEPFVINYRVNAGFIPKSSWIQDKDQGGRIIGEGCHFIDVMSFLIEAKPVSVFAESIESDNQQVENFDNVNIIVKYSDGSIGNLLYLANGDSSLSKEYCEVYCGGDTTIMDNFKSVSFFRNGKKNRKSYDGSKGHREEVKYFLERIKGVVPNKLNFESIYLTTLVTLRIMESLRKNSPVKI